MAKPKPTPKPKEAALASAADLTREVWLRRGKMAWIVFIAFYLATMWLDGVGTGLPSRYLPRFYVFFLQYAALFPRAGTAIVDYRAEGWSCSDRKWIEVDIKPWFKVDADNKENRFHRSFQFYRRDRRVMRALEDYVVERNNETPGAPKIIGVRFTSIRSPYPAIGSHIEPYVEKPLASYPESQKKIWYYTSQARRREKCGEPTPPHEASSSAGEDTPPPAASSSHPEEGEP
jgi:hypothetical protein